MNQRWVATVRQIRLVCGAVSTATFMYWAIRKSWLIRRDLTLPYASMRTQPWASVTLGSVSPESPEHKGSTPLAAPSIVQALSSLTNRKKRPARFYLLPPKWTDAWRTAANDGRSIREVTNYFLVNARALCATVLLSAGWLQVLIQVQGLRNSLTRCHPRMGDEIAYPGQGLVDCRRHLHGWRGRRPSSGASRHGFTQGRPIACWRLPF